MPEITGLRSGGHVAGQRRGAVVAGEERVADRLLGARAGLTELLHEAEEARRRRAEVASPKESSVACAWNHFENIPTFYNWNNRPR